MSDQEQRFKRGGGGGINLQMAYLTAVSAREHIG